MKKLWVVVLFFSTFGTSFAEYLMTLSSPNAIGSGARALGMGGAFIGVADDATAASWNPGGMTQLKHPEISVVGRLARRNETYTVNGQRTENDNDSFDCNYFSIVLPFSFIDRNMVVALNYQQLHDFKQKTEYTVSFGGSITNRRSGYLAPVGVSYSVQIVPQLSMGVTCNFWGDVLGSNTIKQRYRVKLEATILDEVLKREDLVTFTSDIKGINSNWGILWRPIEPFTIGLVYKSPLKADMKMRMTQVTVIGKGDPERDETECLDFEMSESYGVGLSYKLADEFKLAFDVYMTKWSDYTFKDSEQDTYSAITGELQSQSRVDDTVQLRAGAEYLFVNSVKHTTIPFRFGLFYDPIPDQGSPIDVYGMSLGTGISKGRVAFDIFYQFKKTDNGTSMNNDKGWIPEEFYEHMTYISLIYYFL